MKRFVGFALLALMLTAQSPGTIWVPATGVPVTTTTSNAGFVFTTNIRVAFFRLTNGDAVAINGLPDKPFICNPAGTGSMCSLSYSGQGPTSFPMTATQVVYDGNNVPTVTTEPVQVTFASQPGVPNAPTNLIVQ